MTDLTQWLASVPCLDKRPSIPGDMFCQEVEGDDFRGTSEPLVHHHCAAAALANLATTDPDRFAEMFGLPVYDPHLTFAAHPRERRVLGRITKEPNRG